MMNSQLERFAPRKTQTSLRCPVTLAVGVILAVIHLLSTESCLWSLGNLCRLHRIPFAAELVLQQFPPPYSQVVLQRAAEALGFKCGWRQVPVKRLAALPAPWLALVDNIGDGDASAVTHCSWFSNARIVTSPTCMQVKTDP
jgi:hypothetical protein